MHDRVAIFRQKETALQGLLDVFLKLWPSQSVRTSKHLVKGLL